MTKLEEARRRLRQTQRQAIEAAVNYCDGEEYIDEIAFLDVLLVELMSMHEQTPVGWCVVTAHRALLKMAENEGILEPARPRQKHERRSKYDEMAAELGLARSNAKALDQALIELRRQHDHEVYALREECQQLRAELGLARRPRGQLRAGCVVRFWRWLRGRLA